MAKDETVEYCRFAARTMMRQLDELENELGCAAAQDDIELVHRSRVASRRLRASLAIFEGCCPPKEHRKWTKAIKRVTRSLGAARDLDVQIDFLRHYIDNTVGDASLHRLLSTLCLRRAEAQKAIVGSLEQLKRSETSEGIRNWSSEFDVQDEIDLGEIRRIALANILVRLDDLYVFERYVSDPNAIAKQHEMRIAGKHLRYTIEIFSKGYDDGLKPYIKRLKEMQDVLGEMHDCDVWTEILKGRKGAGADRLLADRKERRSALHGEFVGLWKRMKEEHLPEMERSIREVSIGKVPDLEGHGGSIGLIADVHGNLPALMAVLRDAETLGVSMFLNSGDSVGPAPFNRETLDEIMRGEVISVIGNFDREMLGLRNVPEEEVLEAARPKAMTTRLIVSELEGAEAEWLETLPEKMRLNVAGKKVLLTHGSPASINEKVTVDTPEARMRELSSIAAADMVVLGHSHEPLDRVVDDTRFVNPGSVGRQGDGDPRASYAIWDTTKGTVDIRRIAYPVHEVLDRMKECDWPKDAGTTHLRGYQADSAPSSTTDVKEELLIKMAISVAEMNGRYDEHSKQVMDLSVILFKKLGKGLGLDKDDLRSLKCAAIMHDIGWAWGGKGHHRSSFDLIIMSSHLKIPFKDKLLIANIARYHRGSKPKRSHGNLMPLERSELEKMSRLASLLRIADGLDSTHAQRVKIKKVTVMGGRVSIVLDDKDRCEVEIASALKKADLYRDLSGKEVQIE
jgi:putative phosphoesterase